MKKKLEPAVVILIIFLVVALAGFLLGALLTLR